MKFILAAILLSSTLAQAGTIPFIITEGVLVRVESSSCPSSVKRIQTGAASPCDGWIVSEPKMQELAKNADELEISKKLILAQDHLQKLTEEEVEHYKKRSEAGDKALSQSEKQKFWASAGAFALGVIVTGIAAKAAIESTR